MTKIAFFGTSDKSRPILDQLYKSFDLRLCLTKTDTKVGRKREIRVPAVKTWAKDNNIPFLQIHSLKKDDLNMALDALDKHQIELVIVADFNFIIPKQIIEKPTLGIINIHFSLLPKYRGASPVQHAILNGDEMTGVTFQLVDEGMDTGDIIYQFEHKLVGTETTGLLYHELFDQSAKVLPKVITQYVNKEITPRQQRPEDAIYCYSPSHPVSTYIFKEDAKINWQFDDLHKVYAMIRAFHPWPIAWTTLTDMHNAEIVINEKGISKVRTYDALLSSITEKNKDNTNKPEQQNSDIAHHDQKTQNRVWIFKSKVNKDLVVKIYSAAMRDNILEITEIQVEGKSKMTWKDFLNGYSLK